MAALRSVAITGVGLMAPGLVGWTASLPVLRGLCDHRHTALPRLKPALLPAGERRRATPLVRLALAAAEDAMADRLPGRCAIASVFASSGGDLGIVDRICESLITVDRAVSPTLFHNSVHNAPAGYWAIATGCMNASVSLSAHDGSFAAGLIEAVTMVRVEGTPVLLVAYDQPGPPPFHGHRAITEPFGVALVLAPDGDEPHLAKLSLARGCIPEPCRRLADPGLDNLRRANPAARSLPLLIAVAGGENLTIPLSEAVGLAVQDNALQEEAL